LYNQTLPSNPSNPSPVPPLLENDVSKNYYNPLNLRGSPILVVDTIIISDIIFVALFMNCLFFYSGLSDSLFDFIIDSK